MKKANMYSIGERSKRVPTAKLYGQKTDAKIFKDKYVLQNILNSKFQ